MPPLAVGRLRSDLQFRRAFADRPARNVLHYNCCRCCCSQPNSYQKPLYPGISSVAMKLAGTVCLALACTAATASVVPRSSNGKVLSQARREMPTNHWCVSASSHTSAGTLNITLLFLLQAACFGEFDGLDHDRVLQDSLKLQRSYERCARGLRAPHDAGSQRPSRRKQHLW